MIQKSYKSLNGILLLNKPTGITSNKALQIVKNLFNVKKAGHTGSLDPLASGMLPICFGEATKFSQILLDSDKCYLAEGLLGVTTTTQDSEGEVIKECVSNVTKEELLKTLDKFTGEITQIPSMFSALKHKGKPLYKYARVGETIERKPRTVFIKELELLEFNEQRFSIHVACTKGTYIRNLVEDIGNELLVGAHVTKLHRNYVAGFKSKPMYTLEQLQEFREGELEEILLDVDTALENIPKLILKESDILSLHQGREINLEDTNAIEGFIRLYDCNNNFYGLGMANNHKLTPVKMLSSKYLNQTLKIC